MLQKSRRRSKISARQDDGTTAAAPIVKEVTIDAPVERVFAALTDHRQLAQWWGDGVDRWESDLCVGGRWTSYGTFTDGSAFSVGGVYRAVQAPRLLEMTCQHWGENAPETIIHYELAENDGKTHVRLTHSGIADMQFHADHCDAWDRIFQRLAAFINS